MKMDNIDNLEEKVLASEICDDISVVTDLEFLDSFFLDDDFTSNYETTSLSEIKDLLDNLECVDFIGKDIFEQLENSSYIGGASMYTSSKKAVEDNPGPIIQIITKRGVLTVNPIEGCDRSLLQAKIDNKDKKTMKLIDSLKVGIHDKRRKYMSEFFSYHNTYDFAAMRKFLHQNSVVDDLVGHFEIIDTNVEVILPKKIYIRGLDAILSFIVSFLRAVPDFILFHSDTVIRNRVGSSMITTKLMSTGTRVYRVVLNNCPGDAIVSKQLDDDNNNSNNNNNNNSDNNNNNDTSNSDISTEETSHETIENRKRKSEVVNSTISSERSINITDLCDKIEKIDLSDNITISPPPNNNNNNENEDIDLIRRRKNSVNFQCGPKLPMFFKLESSGTATFHLNADHKIYLYEYKVTHKKTLL